MVNTGVKSTEEIFNERNTELSECRLVNLK